ncbi:MAG: hypothetical protein ACYTDT_09925 [Planctomycetota bacterium]|jgi:hypothetical protein
MSRFILTFDYDHKDDVMKALKKVQGVKVNSLPRRNATVNVQTVTRTLDDETRAVKAMEDIIGVVDLRLV